jgi:hypothetical protein
VTATSSVVFQAKTRPEHFVGAVMGVVVQQWDQQRDLSLGTLLLAKDHLPALLDGQVGKRAQSSVKGQAVPCWQEPVQRIVGDERLLLLVVTAPTGERRGRRARCCEQSVAEHSFPHFSCYW